MPAGSPFVVPVDDLLRHQGRTRAVSIETPVDWSIEHFAVLPEPPLGADIDLTAIPGGIVVRGQVEVVVQATCGRCLRQWDEARVVDVNQLAETVDEGDDGYVLDGDLLDLEPILRDEVLLGLPLLARCDPPCSQLGEGAETRLNAAAPEARSDTPFAALQDLFDTGD